MRKLSFSRTKLILWILAIGVLLAAVWLVRWECQRVQQAIEELEDRNQKLREHNEKLRKEIEYQIYQLNTAKEFRVDPTLVGLVYNQACKVVDPNSRHWRLINSAKEATWWTLSLIKVESGGDPWAMGRAGEVGLTQLKLSTARQYREGLSKEDLFDPVTNVEIYFKHFTYLLKRYDGNFALALYGWNRGQGKIDRLIRHGRPIANGYVEKVYMASVH